MLLHHYHKTQAPVSDRVSADLCHVVKHMQPP